MNSDSLAIPSLPDQVETENEESGFGIVNLRESKDMGEDFRKPNVTLPSASSSQVAFIAASNSLRRRDEEPESGVRGTQFEESPIRD